MLRSSLIYLSKAEWAKRMVTRWGFARKTSARFVAGETLDEAIRVVQSLNRKGIFATLDHLGEHTTNELEAEQATLAILNILDAINEKEIKSNVSVKLSQIGLILGKNICEKNLTQILTSAKQYNNFVRIDMEDSSCVDQTLDLFQLMLERGFDNTGIVIQSYLYRSELDLQRILKLGGKIRLCKGAYKEPSELAFPKKKDVDKNYDHLVAIIVDNIINTNDADVINDGKIPPRLAVATHDINRINYAKEYAKKVGLPMQSLEFQMLYGIRRDLQDLIVKQGYPVRIYVPFGTQWYPYFVRRLAERPANLWFFVSNFFKK